MVDEMIKVMVLKKTEKTNGKRAATIPRHTIENLQSFLQVTEGARRLAGLYFYMKLDYLISLAGDVADDFLSKRPHLYSQIKEKKDGGFAPILATLKARTGTHELFPSLEQRKEIYLPTFGRPDDLTCKFYQVTQPLLEAAREFSKNVFDGKESNGNLRKTVRRALLACKRFYKGLDGAALAWHKEEVLYKLTEDYAYKVFRHDGVAKVFAGAQSILEEFPYQADSDVSKLVEVISNTPIREVSPNQSVTHHFFSNLQRCALCGCEAIATIIDFKEGDPDESLDILIEKCLAWATALHDIDEAVGIAISSTILRSLL